MRRVMLPLGVPRSMEAGLSEKNITSDLQPFDHPIGHVLNLSLPSYEHQDTNRKMRNKGE